MTKFCEPSSDGRIVRFTYGQGTELELDLSTLDESIQAKLMSLGAIQIVTDSFLHANGDYDIGIGNGFKVIERLQQRDWESALKVREEDMNTDEEGERYELLIDTKLPIQDQIIWIRKILGYYMESRFRELEKDARFQNETICDLMSDLKALKRAVKQLQQSDSKSHP